MAGEDELRRRSFGVEESDEVGEDLIFAEFFASAREEGSVSVVSSAAEEEDLDAGTGSALSASEEVCVIVLAEVDGLVGGDGCEGTESVAESGGGFEVL